MKKTKKTQRRIDPLLYNPLGDRDKDGAMNFIDCDPENPDRKGIYDWLKSKVTPIYHRVYTPTITRVRTTHRAVQRTIAPYKPTVSYQRAAQRRAAVKRKTVEVAKKVQKYLTVPEEEKRDIGQFGGTIFYPKHDFRPTPTPTVPVPGEMGLLVGAKAITPILRRILPDVKQKIVSVGRRAIVSEIRKTPGYLATQILQKHVFPHVKKGYDIGTGAYIAAESKALTTAQAARISQGNVTARNLGFSSEENLRTNLDAITNLSQQATVTKYYSDQKKVSDCYTKWVEAYYDRVAAYNKLKNPTQSQYDTLLDSKSSSTVYFETQLSKFESLYPSKPSSVVRYEKGVKPFFTPSGELKPSVLTYISKGEKEYAAFQAYEKKERVTKEKWAPKYGGFTPLTYPTMELGAKASKPLIEGVEKYIPVKHEKVGYGAVGFGKGIAETAAYTPEWLGTLLPSAEILARKTPTAVKSIPLGLGLFAGGLVKGFKEKPQVATGRIAGMVLLPYAGKKISPIKYTGAMKIPTGAGRVKTWYTLGKGLPREFKGIQETAVFRGPTALGKIELTRIPGVFKQTHLIPEAVTYRGIYFRTPAKQPYLGKHFLVGRTTGPGGTIRGWQVGQPYFDLPTSYRVFSGVEAAATLPTVKEGLSLPMQKLMTEAFYLQKRLSTRKGITKPLKMEEVEAFKGLPKEARAEVGAVLRRHRRNLLFYGSSAKEAQIARISGERGGIKPGDIDVEVMTTASRMTEGLILPKRLQSQYTLSRLGIPTWKSKAVKRIGEKMPGTTPQKLSVEIADIFKKYLGKENVVVEYKPLWQMYSIKKVVGWKKTPLGKEPVTEGLFDIHPESATFEFGMKPLKPVKTTIDTGLKESWWTKRKPIKMTSLAEEFERSFASIMQIQEKGVPARTVIGRDTVVGPGIKIPGVELFISPRYGRMKDIARFVQTGKMLSEYKGLKIETGLFPFKKYRLKGIKKEQAALKSWEEYSTSFPELRELQTDITVKALSTSAADILKSQRIGSSLFLSQSALALPKRIRFEEVYKPKIPKPKVGKPKPKRGRKADYDYYTGRRGDYYGAGYYFAPGYYGGFPYGHERAVYKPIPREELRLGFVISPPAKYTPMIPITKGIAKPPIPTKRHLIPTISIPDVIIPSLPPPPPYVPPPTPPPTPPVTPPYVPPSRPPPTYVPPFLRIPPPVPPPIRIKKDDKIKPRRGLPWAAYQKSVVNPILQADQLLRKML